MNYNSKQFIRLNCVFKIIIRYRMFDWLFGSSKPKQQKKSEGQDNTIAKQDMWAYDFVKQYLVSPIWRNPLLDFIEENCLIFDDNQQNKFQYTKIHQEFVGLCGLLLESIIEETGITEKLLEQCIMKGLTDKKDQRIFQQVLLCDNFMAFKKIMVSKNKQLEIAASQAQSLKQGKKISAQQTKIDEKELERLQIQKAIALSLAMQQKMKQEQQKQLQQAIRLSRLEAQKEQIAKSKAPKVQEKLPPLVIGSNKLGKTISDFKQQEKILVKQIQTLKIKQDSQKKQDENSQQRKKRLLEQRQLIKKKKMQERQQQLKAFVQNKPTSSQNKEQLPKVSQEQLERRRKLMQRLKQQLKE